MQQCGNRSRWSVIIAITLLKVFLSAPVHAAVFTVNIGFDFGRDANPGDGVCETAPGNGICSLRAAIQETNALAGEDTIILPPNRYPLTTAVGTDLIIAGNLTITGGGASTTFISGALKSGRVLAINAGFTVNLSGVTISDTENLGGAVGNAGTLTLSDSTVSNNISFFGASGIGIFNSGTLTLINSTVSGNSGRSGGGFPSTSTGGGIYNSGKLTLMNSTVSGNSTAQGGGITSVGGGIYNSGKLTLVNSTVSGNNAAQGGGIYNDGTANLFNVTITNNQADDKSGGQGVGGGIFNNSGTLTLVNSTVSGNNAAQGGGIYNDGTANLFNATITNNRADDKSGGQGIGGGVFNSNNGTFNFQNTILAGNFETLDFVLTPGECDGTINSIGSNLMTMADCTVSGSVPILGNPNIGPLQNNGGPTQTHALLSGSPAIDAGNPGGCRDQLGALITTDQRGFPRPADGNNDGVATCDIGAYESTRVGAEFGEVLSGALGQASVLAGGIESGGASRGPAFQLFDSAGMLQTTQFVLNPDFRIDVSFVVGNFDADTAGEILVGGRETSGLVRGPAYQLFDSDGTLKLTRFVLNPDFSDVSFSPFNVGSDVLACGREVSGRRRGPAYQVFNAGGVLRRTQFVLNPDFTADNSCLGINPTGPEVIVGGREVTGLARGPAFQIFHGLFGLTQFVLNPNFTETKFTVVDVGGSMNIVVSGRETSGAVRGPAYQAFDASGNFILTRFVLNPDFTDFQLFGANTTNAVSGQEIVTGGTETIGLARGPAIQVWDNNGNHLFTRFVLNPDFSEVTFSKIDINNDGVDEILVVGRESKGLQRGPAFQLFDGNGNHLGTQFVLNPDFSNLRFFAVDQNGDGDKEIGIGGIETSGSKRGPAYQIFESNGALLQTRFVLNPDF